MVGKFIAKTVSNELKLTTQNTENSRSIVRLNCNIRSSTV